MVNHLLKYVGDRGRRYIKDVEILLMADFDLFPGSFEKISNVWNSWNDCLTWKREITTKINEKRQIWSPF